MPVESNLISRDAPIVKCCADIYVYVFVAIYTRLNARDTLLEK